VPRPIVFVFFQCFCQVPRVRIPTFIFFVRFWPGEAFRLSDRLYFLTFLKDFLHWGGPYSACKDILMAPSMGIWTFYAAFMVAFSPKLFSFRLSSPYLESYFPLSIELLASSYEFLCVFFQRGALLFPPAWACDNKCVCSTAVLS